MASTRIFVFGSNLAGIHGRGSALEARMRYGAKVGVGVGLQGSSYAIPTKSYRLKVLTLREISCYVTQFLSFARKHPELEFHVVKIGCGLAGYKPEQIAPMFVGYPPNVNLHVDFLRVLGASEGKTGAARESNSTFFLQPQKE